MRLGARMIELSMLPGLWQNAGALGLLNPVGVARNNDLATNMLLQQRPRLQDIGWPSVSNYVLVTIALRRIGMPTALLQW